MALGVLSACTPKAPALPTGTGTPFPDLASAYQQATASCGGVTTFTASMALSGRAGTTKLRGRIDAGFASPARARLEGIPPFGKPVFILVADGGAGTLFLTRDERVLRGAPPDQIVEALAGVALGPDALMAAVSGCGLERSEPSDGRAFANGWVAGTTSSGKVYLRRAGTGWQIAAATKGPLTLTYEPGSGATPASLRLRAESQGRLTADLRLRLSDVAVNTTLDPRTFEIDIPPDAAPLTLEELRRAGPLGGR